MGHCCRRRLLCSNTRSWYAGMLRSQIHMKYVYELYCNAFFHCLLFLILQRPLIPLQSMLRRNRNTVSGFFLAGKTMFWLPVSIYTYT